MADPIAIAERAQPESVWAPCEGCQAHRRLDEQSLCYKCKMDPLRTEIARLKSELRDRDAKIQRLNYRNGETLRRLRVLRESVDRRSYFVLSLDETEYLALVAIMVDVVHDDPNEVERALHGRLTQDG